MLDKVGEIISKGVSCGFDHIFWTVVLLEDPVTTPVLAFRQIQKTDPKHRI